MRRRSKVVLALLLVIIIVFFTFSFLDFRAITSETVTHSREITTSIGQPKIDLASGLYVYVDGEDGLTKELRSGLTEKLRQGGIEVLKTGSLEEKYDRQVLVVAILDREVSYNPVYPSATIELFFVYSSSGNTACFKAFKGGEQAADLSRGESGEDELLMRGELNLTDTTKGIISHKAYQKHIAAEIAEGIFRGLLRMSTLEMNTGDNGYVKTN